MAVNFSIKQVPESIAKRLRQRAERNHRSLQRELLAIIEAAAAEPGGAQVNEPAPASYTVKTVKSKRVKAGTKKIRTLEEFWQRCREIGPGLPPGGETGTSIIRRDRDERSRR